MVTKSPTDSKTPVRRKYVPVVGPTLRKVLILILALFALIMVNSVYLVSIRILGLSTGDSHENWFFLNMFIAVFTNTMAAIDIEDEDHEGFSRILTELKAEIGELKELMTHPAGIENGEE